VSDRRQSLFQAVLDDPDAEAPRAAFAKWLDEQGDPQGEFIRLQLEAARELRRGLYCEDYARLSEAARALQAAHGREWSRDVEVIASQPRFYRGFVEGVTIDARMFLDHAPELYRAAPVRHVVMTDARDVIGEIAASPHLGRLTSLGLQGNGLGDDEVGAIIQSPHLERLKALNLSFNDAGMPALEALCASKGQPVLAYVNFHANRVDAPVEEYGVDWMTGRIVRESIALPEFGDQLETKYGPQLWLHGPSRLANYPPSEEDF